MKAFTMTIDGIAIACIVEENWEAAKYIFEHRDFRTELEALLCESDPLWDKSSPIGLREATSDEAARAHLARAQMQSSHDDGPLKYGSVIFFVPVSDAADDEDCEN